jgi:hypothetical protein
VCTYKDLREVPPKACKHEIIFEDEIVLVYHINPKYSLMVKEEIVKKNLKHNLFIEYLIVNGYHLLL